MTDAGARQPILEYENAGFTVPHVLFHAFNPAPGLTGSEDVVNVVVLASSLVFAAVIAWGALRPADE